MILQGQNTLNAELAKSRRFNANLDQEQTRSTVFKLGTARNECCSWKATTLIVSSTVVLMIDSIAEEVLVITDTQNNAFKCSWTEVEASRKFS